MSPDIQPGSFVAPVPTPRKKRAPLYNVYEAVEHMITDNDAARAWMQIGTAVEAPTARAAITEATRGFDDERRYGTFATVLVGNLTVHTRTRTVVEREDWS